MKEGKPRKTIAEALEDINETLRRIEQELEGINRQIGMRNGYDR